MSALVGLVGCGSTVARVSDGPAVDGQEASTQSLHAGTLDTTSTFSLGVCTGAYNTDPAVGPVGTCRRGTVRCSGTLIAPNLVLTARHCVHQSTLGPEGTSGANPCDGSYTTTPIIPGGTHVTTADSVMLGAPKWYEVAEVLVPSGANLCADDVALLVLSTNVPRSEARPVGVDFNRDLARRPPTELAIVGRGAISDQFGLDANGDWNGVWLRTLDDLKRRQQQHIPFLCATNGSTGCPVVSHEVPGTHVFPTPANFYVFGESVGAGDSGSAAFDQKRFRQRGCSLRVIGVNTWTFISPEGRAAPAGGVRVDGFKQFFQDGYRRAAAVGGFTEWCGDEEGEDDEG